MAEADGQMLTHQKYRRRRCRCMQRSSTATAAAATVAAAAAGGAAAVAALAASTRCLPGAAFSSRGPATSPWHGHGHAVLRRHGVAQGCAGHGGGRGVHLTRGRPGVMARSVQWTDSAVLLRPRRPLLSSQVSRVSRAADGVFGAALDVVPLQDILQQLPEFIKSMGMFGPVLFFGTFVGLECLSLPGAPLMMASGCLFGVLQGCAISVAALVSAASISFFLARTVLRPQLKKLMEGNQVFNDINVAVESDGFKIICLLRLAPLLPFALSNYAYGLSSVSFRDYFFATLLGVMPGTVATVYLSTTAAASVIAAAEEAEEAAVATAPPSTPGYYYVVGVLLTVLLLRTVTDIAKRAVKKSVTKKR